MMKNDDYENQFQIEIDNYNEVAELAIGSAAIIKWIRNQSELGKIDCWYKWVFAIYPVFENEGLEFETFNRHIKIGVGLANQVNYRHLLIKKFCYFEDNESLGILLVNIQTFAEIEKQYDEPEYIVHQKLINSIIKEEFEEGTSFEIFDLAEKLVSKARKQGLDDVTKK